MDANLSGVISQRQAYKALAPRATGVMIKDKETRFDAPCLLLADKLVYIGCVIHEAWHVNPHYHDHFELCYVAKGQGWFAIDDSYYKVQAGDLFLTRPGEVHQGGAAGNTAFSLYYTGFQLQHLHSLELAYYALDSQRVVNVPSEMIQQLFETIISELSQKQSHYLEMVQSQFSVLLVQSLRRYEQQSQSTVYAPAILSPLLRQVISYIHTEVGNPASIQHLAEQMHVSRSHLTREFKRAMGISLGHYLRLLCIERARQALRESSDTVSQIANTLNFPSIHTFSMFFKRQTGLSPQAYRQLVTSSVDESKC
ncbi:AraC family transcriptional regulator [Tengunoibacter tsumagoiensis]|uniref:AraC family transcriptional regulator n=1 Tax=Tengunoibacter tsumagoiensis TaxID=2014871 RepID=A0A401ZVD6_9CHLR|nr:AraC family transcriptional regulator [Tengunoibacter tsumagoiensis]GCE10853.1 AraC family transcriptional regulator [Tengunoibacter tsumagoiensis]